MEPNFFHQVYILVQKIPSGKVATYGQLAYALGTRDARRIGHALHANRNPDVPCHRVINRSGRLAPSFAFGGPARQYQLLRKEGVSFLNHTHVNLALSQWQTKKSLS